MNKVTFAVLKNNRKNRAYQRKNRKMLLVFKLLFFYGLLVSPLLSSIGGSSSIKVVDKFGQRIEINQIHNHSFCITDVSDTDIIQEELENKSEDDVKTHLFIQNENRGLSSLCNLIVISERVRYASRFYLNHKLPLYILYKQYKSDLEIV